MADNRIIEINLGNVKSRVLEVLGGVSKEDAAIRTRRAYEAGFEDGNDDPQSGSIAAGGYGYRSAATGGSIRDFSKLHHDTVLENVWSLYMSNPIADRSMDIKRDHILGRGVRPQVEDEALKEIVDAFWDDNKLDKRSKEFTLQLFLLGDQCYPSFVRQTDGRVRLGYIDPSQIEDVIAHPDNALEFYAVVIKEQTSLTGWQKSRGKRVYRIIREDETFVSETETRAASYEDKMVTAEQATLEPWEEVMLREYGLSEYSGSCFYFKVNSVSNQPRGWSDLLRAIDWADQHDESLFSLADFVQLASYFAWMVKMMGANQDEVEKRAAELRKHPPKKGSVNVHNDAEEWTFNKAGFNHIPNIDTADAIFNHIWGGLGYPRHWYTEGDRTNRATAEAQGSPTWRSLEHDQDIIRDMFLAILTFVRDQAEIAGQWIPKEEDSGDIDLIMPEMTTRDIGKIGQALVSIVNSLTVALSNQWISHQTAMMIFARMIAELGVEIDPIDEQKKIEEEQADEEQAVGNAINRQLSRMLQVGQNGEEPVEEEDNEI